MVHFFAAAGLLTYVALAASMLGQAAPTRRQLGNLECNLNRAEITFHVNSLATTVGSFNTTTLTAANGTAEDSKMAIQDGAQGAGTAINAVLSTLLAGGSPSPDLRDAIAGNLSIVGTALQGLQPSDSTEAGLLATATQHFVNSALAADGIVNNC